MRRHTPRRTHVPIPSTDIHTQTTPSTHLVAGVLVVRVRLEDLVQRAHLRLEPLQLLQPARHGRLELALMVYYGVYGIMGRRGGIDWGSGVGVKIYLPI